MSQTLTESQLTENDYCAENIILESLKGFYSFYTQSHLSTMMKADLRHCVKQLLEKYFHIKLHEAAMLEVKFGARDMVEGAALDTILGLVERACKGKHYGAVGEFNQEVIAMWNAIRLKITYGHNAKPSNPE